MSKDRPDGARADVSFAVAILPDRDFAASVSRASLEISARWKNSNRIDETTFPAHISIHLAGTVHKAFPDIVRVIEGIAERTLFPRITALELYANHDRFLGIRCDATQLQPFHDDVVRACAAIHRSCPAYRPRLISRWPELTASQKKQLIKFGSDKVFGQFDAHFSVAQVAQHNVSDARRLATELILLPTTFAVRAIQIVDIGHRNERWRIVKEWPAHTDQMRPMIISRQGDRE